MLFRRLVPADLAAYRTLRLAALREAPIAFGGSYEEESQFPPEVWAKRLENTADQWVLGAFSGQRLVGMILLIRARQLKTRHKADIYSMYIAPRWRKRGIGRELVTRIIEVARTLDGLKLLRIGAISSNRPALKLYTAAGFRIYGEEPQAFFVNGRYHPETLLALVLKPAKARSAQR